MTTLYISHMAVNVDNLGRYVTTLTQEVMVKINQQEEDLFLSTIRAGDGIIGDVEYDNNDTLDVSGSLVDVAIKSVNNTVKHTLIAPITEIKDDQLYRIEFEH